MMNRNRGVFAAAVLLVVTLGIPATAQDSGFGIGVIVGEPTGLSAKLWLSKNTALDLAAAWSFAREPSTSIHADYLLHFHDVVQVEKGRLPLYLGLGGAFTFLADPEVGIRFVAGVSYLFETVPVDIFLEAAPIFLVLPGTAFDFAGALGARYYFPPRAKGK